MAASNEAAHARLDPALELVGGDADDARPRRSSASGTTIGSGSGTEVESQRSWPAMTLQSSAAVAHREGERPDLVERRAERDQPVPRHRAVGRLEPDHAAQRGRLADRAAGVGAERERREPGGDGRRRSAAGAARDTVGSPTGCGWAPKAEFSVDEPIANSSMLVLPRETRPALVAPA